MARCVFSVYLWSLFVKLQMILAASALTALTTLGAHAATFPADWSVNGNAGTAAPNGDVAAPPAQGPGYYYVSTVNGVNKGGELEGIGGSGTATTGSNVTTSSFSAAAGEMIEFFFNYVTSDGAGYADYGWARLLDATTNSQVALLFTARTTPDGSSVPGFEMPTPEATLDPSSVTINNGATVWDVLGDDSGDCYAAGCGSTGWVKSTYALKADGTYKLQFGVTNWGDTGYQSAMAFAGAQVGDVIITPPVDPAPVPLPASAVLLGAGMGALGFLRRRKTA